MRILCYPRVEVARLFCFSIFPWTQLQRTKIKPKQTPSQRQYRQRSVASVDAFVMAPNCSLSGDVCLCKRCGVKMDLSCPSSLPMLRVFVCAAPGCPFQSDRLEEVDEHRAKRHNAYR